MTENIDDLTPSDDESETVVTRPERDPKTGRFLQGTTGLPGRPKGARNKLAEAMIDDLYQDWKAHGIQAIRKVRETRPADYLKIVAMVVSKAEDVSVVLIDWASLWRRLWWRLRPFSAGPSQPGANARTDITWRATTPATPTDISSAGLRTLLKVGLRAHSRLQSGNIRVEND